MKILALMTVSALALSAAANADVSISSKPTGNMSCDAGVCTATAQKAVLNVGDLQAMLASGDVTLKTGTFAKDIDIAQPLTWSSTAQLTLDAQQSVTVKKQVTVAGQGALTIDTDDSGSGGDLYFFDKSRVTFGNLSSSLVINGNSFVLADTLQGLASAIAANPNGFFALASTYDAKKDGMYASPPIPMLNQGGVLEGLGNSIDHFSLMTASQDSGLIGQNTGSIRDLLLTRVDLRFPAGGNAYGGLVGENEVTGIISGAHTSGSITGSGIIIGGLAGSNYGSIVNSSSESDIQAAPLSYYVRYIGGLAAQNNGQIVGSYATGRVIQESLHTDNREPPSGCHVFIGGLVGFTGSAANLGLGQIKNSYSQGAVEGDSRSCVGGMLGASDYVDLSSLYTTAAVSVAGVHVGGFLGQRRNRTHVQSCFWDVDTGGVGQGAGGGKSEGIVGITDAQLKSGLPSGFDPKVWGQSPKINNGYPYLLANLPK